METRDFPVDVIASLSTGIVLCEGGFGKMHEAAEYLMGHPVWTHHFANEQLWQDMRRTIAEQCPGMPTEADGIGKNNWREYAAKLEAEFEAQYKKDFGEVEGAAVAELKKAKAVADAKLDKAIDGASSGGKGGLEK